MVRGYFVFYIATTKAAEKNGFSTSINRCFTRMMRLKRCLINVKPKTNSIFSLKSLFLLLKTSCTKKIFKSIY